MCGSNTPGAAGCTLRGRPDIRYCDAQSRIADAHLLKIQRKHPDQLGVDLRAGGSKRFGTQLGTRGNAPSEHFHIEMR
jgi:hypothetical protein